MPKFQVLFLPFLLLFTAEVFSNDGSFRSSGNTLIPIHESRISIQKEILSIKYDKNRKFMVHVYYEFYNPDAERNVEVGFEARMPSGIEDRLILSRDSHPFIRNFSVRMNNENLKYNCNLINSKEYFKDGSFINIPDSLFKTFSEMRFHYGASMYVYHFNAHFKKGINVVEHTYSFDGSTENAVQYIFSYMLSTANRWRNKRIDDFTLNIDMGKFRKYYIFPGFFKSANEWQILGTGFKKDTSFAELDEFSGKIEIDKRAVFFMREGSIQFQKKNFRPSSELYLSAVGMFMYFEVFDVKYDVLTFDPDDLILDSVPDTSVDLVLNLVHARRGYVSDDKKIQAYYQALDWYTPDINYIPLYANLTEKEKQWIRDLKVKRTRY